MSGGSAGGGEAKKANVRDNKTFEMGMDNATGGHGGKGQEHLHGAANAWTVDGRYSDSFPWLSFSLLPGLLLVWPLNVRQVEE